MDKHWRIVNRDVNIDYRGNTCTEPVNHDSMQDKSLQDLRRSNKKSGNWGKSEASIKRVLPDDGIFTNLVKDSIMAHERKGVRPMFVNIMLVTIAGSRAQQRGILKQLERSTRRQINQIWQYRQLFHPWVRIVSRKATCKLES